MPHLNLYDLSVCFARENILTLVRFPVYAEHSVKGVCDQDYLGETVNEGYSVKKVRIATACVDP